jgi:hypothetical protein
MNNENRFKRPLFPLDADAISPLETATFALG